ncbi:MAG: hypothetical protein FJW31_08320 [Acidobacteria bacterium]|nr:hypothetical protein [Acidobacteriota bacterium]
MKQALVVALVLTVGSLSAQRHGGGPLGPVGHGFGNVVFPGTGIPNPVPGHVTALGAAVRGVYPGGNGRGFYRPQQPAIAYPIALPVPVYTDAYDYTGFAPQMPVVAPQYYPPPQPPQQQQSTVIINQHYTPERAQPVVREYSASELGSYQAPVPDHPAPPPSAAAPPVKIDADSPTVYLIALKDGTVYSAYAYWVEGDTLHYITTKHSHNRATVTLVDSELSNQLNRQRKVEFKLNAGRASARGGL